MSQTRKIRWLIAHEPVDLFLRTAEAFQQKIAELTNNAFEVEIFTPTEYKKQFDSYDKKSGPMVELDEGNIEMSQMHITELACWHSPEFYALEMPFIFRDHEHARRVLEGEIGRTMLDNLETESPAKGLAFTYSGGFRCVASETPVNSIDGFKGAVFATAVNPVTIDTIEALGATPAVFNIKDFARQLKEEGNGADALETTITRYLAQFQTTNKKYLLNTKHSLFLTSIIIGKQFWNELDEATQDKFKEAVQYASRLERQWSVQEAEEFAEKFDHSDIGVTYAELSAEETEKFKQLVEPLYNKYRDFFYPGLIDGIIQS
jgi:TRAP-type C4-dicarboxylate transport system substrate-binding protein